MWKVLRIIIMFSVLINMQNDFKVKFVTTLSSMIM